MPNWELLVVVIENSSGGEFEADVELATFSAAAMIAAADGAADGDWSGFSIFGEFLEFLIFL